MSLHYAKELMEKFPITIAQQEAIFRAYENEIRYQIRLRKQHSIVYYVGLILNAILYFIFMFYWK